MWGVNQMKGHRVRFHLAARKSRQPLDAAFAALPTRLAGWGGFVPADEFVVSRNGYDWQSAGVRRVSFFSAAYLSAAALTIGRMIWSSACSQSDEKFHLAPSQV
jgi:hypothetical protein